MIAAAHPPSKDRPITNDAPGQLARPEREHAAVPEPFAAQAAVCLETARVYAESIEENQRRSIEKALRASEATLLQAAKANHGGSFAWEIGRAALSCSAGFCRLFGFDPAQSAIAASALLERIHADDRDRVVLHTRGCVAQNRPIRIDCRVVCNDMVRYLSSLAELMGPDGGAGMYIGTVVDVTERRAAEETLRAAQAELARVGRVSTVSQLRASIVHELSQPLMSIASNAGASLRWLERDPPRLDQVQRGLVEIAAQSQRAGDLMQGLQALVRKSTAVIEAVDLHAAIEHMLSITGDHIERQQVALEVSLGARFGWVHGDAPQLRQVLLNLVIDAIEAMREVHGRPRVLSIASRSNSAGRIDICVEDTGIGVDAVVAGRMVDAFDGARNAGMGMGLATCRSIIEAHAGSIEARTRTPYGCSMVLSLAEIAPPAHAQADRCVASGNSGGA